MSMSQEERKAHYQRQIELLTPPNDLAQEALLQAYQTLLECVEETEAVSVDE